MAIKKFLLVALISISTPLSIAAMDQNKNKALDLCSDLLINFSTLQELSNEAQNNRDKTLELVGSQLPVLERLKKITDQSLGILEQLSAQVPTESESYKILRKTANQSLDKVEQLSAQVPIKNESYKVLGTIVGQSLEAVGRLLAQEKPGEIAPVQKEFSEIAVEALELVRELESENNRVQRECYEAKETQHRVLKNLFQEISLELEQ